MGSTNPEPQINLYVFYYLLHISALVTALARQLKTPKENL